MKKLMHHKIHAPGPHNPGPQGAGPQGVGKSGLPWGKIAIGCGCLSLFLMCAVGAVAYFLIDAGSKWAEEVGISEIVEMAEEAEQAEQNAPAPGSEEARIEQEARERKEASLQPEKIRSYLNEPLTKKDVREHFAFVDKWKESPEYKNWVVQFEKMKELDKQNDDSVAGGLKAVGQSAKWMSAARDVMEAFDKQVREDGGYEKYYGRMMRVGGVVAASDTIAKANRKLKDANSDAVADRMIKERPEIAKQYQKNFDEAKKAIAEAEKRKKAGKEPGAESMAAYAGLMSVMQGPGTIALARMPEKSFETWKKLSDKERKQLRDSLTESIAPGAYFGLFSVNPAALVMSAFTAEMQELQPGN